MSTATIFVPRIDALTFFQVARNPTSIDQKNESLLHKVLVTVWIIECWRKLCRNECHLISLTVDWIELNTGPTPLAMVPRLIYAIGWVAYASSTESVIWEKGKYQKVTHLSAPWPGSESNRGLLPKRLHHNAANVLVADAHPVATKPTMSIRCSCKTACACTIFTLTTTTNTAPGTRYCRHRMVYPKSFVRRLDTATHYILPSRSA
jgi:hypothetical protein